MSSNIRNQLEALAKECTKKQQEIVVSLLTKILEDAIECKQQQQSPRLLNIDAIVRKTNCYSFINILLSAGYTKVNHDKQLKFDIDQFDQIDLILNDLTKQQSDNIHSSMLSRNTIKLEVNNKDPLNKHYHGRKSRRSIINKFPDKLGSYRLQKVIGSGSYGTVYLCTNEKLKVFAMKVFNKTKLQKTEMESISKEIKILSTLPTHPNTVKLIEVVEDDYFLGIVFPYFESGSLYSFIRDFGVGMLPEINVKALVDQILKAIEFLHKNGIIHRDIKASNILISNDGVVKLSDFGIAMYFDDDLSVDEKDMDDEVVMGSPYWMAPEIIQMEKASFSCDIWSVGVTAIELFTGYPPYTHLNPMGAMYRIVEDPYPSTPANISEGFKDFLYQCLQKDPVKRPSAKDLLSHEWLTSIQTETFLD